MRSTKLVLSSVATGLVLAVGGGVFAVGALAAPGDPRPENKGEGRAVDRTCIYPPSRTSILALSASASATKPGTGILYGEMAANGCPVSFGKISLYSSTTRDGTFTDIAQTTTNATGQFSFTVIFTTTTFYRVAYTGDTNLDPVISNVAQLTVPRKR